MTKKIFLFLSLVLFICFFSSLYAGEKPVPKTTKETKETRLTAVPKGYQVKEIILSPDKMKTVHILFKEDKEEKKDKFYIFFDNKLSKPYDSVNKTAFSPDSKRFVCCARKGEKEYFVLDGKESKPYDSV